MVWSTLFSAFVGGLAGSLATAAIGYMRLRDDRRKGRRERQWLDASVVADADQLLKDLNPQRRAANLDRRQGVEDERWIGLDKRAEQLYRDLAQVAAGHPSEAVQASAR
jgi:hypothetical protein